MNLKHFCSEYHPDIVFISEPQAFQCDIASLSKPFLGEYSVLLNSEETSHPELALDCPKAHGGTLVMWRTKLDPFITPLPTTSPSFLPILLQLPGFSPSIHIALYLPTSGRDPDFVSSLSLLDDFVDEMSFTYGCPIFIRGDANCNPNNTRRTALFSHFTNKHKFNSIDFGHPSHHHFTGDGLHDSQLDVLLHQSGSSHPEAISDIFCKLQHPLVTSAHDVIMSTCFLLPQPSVSQDSSENIVAPKVENDRIKIIWDEDCTEQYQELIGENLSRLRETWSNFSSPAAVSILLKSTNDVLSTAASASNKVIKLGQEFQPKPVLNLETLEAQTKVLRLSKLVKHMSASSNSSVKQLCEAKQAVTAARAAYKRAINADNKAADDTRDQLLYSVLQSNPRKVYSTLKSKGAKSSKIHSLKVGNKVYTGSNVSDGFFDSLSSLKAPDMSHIHSSPSYQSIFSDYSTIRKICSSGLKIPPISPRDATEILYNLKPDVNDLYSVTARHYINAGIEGARHFHFLMNLIIQNVNLFSLEELNSVWAMVLHKGHGKPKDSDRSYRTISTCPLLSKSLDKYIGSLFESGWAAAQAETQFQGSGSSHELAALLLTESIQHAVFRAKKPLFVVMLDAKSAFDKILAENIIRKAFLAGSRGHGLLYLADRLANRKTYVEWDKSIMGPICDLLGVEQGGCLSDRLYKLANNEQLSVAQDSQLGLDLHGVIVSSIGQADDTCLISDCIFKLQNLLQLTVDYCSKYHVELVPEKTKLLCFSPTGLEASTLYWKTVSPVTLNSEKIPFSSEAEHLGILRSSNGNLPNLMSRMSAHNGSLRGVLHGGLAKGHNGNPAAALQVEKLYAAPVLLSGVAALVLNKADEDILHHHYKLSLERLQRLHKCTPEPVVCFLGGSLPLTALLHLRQFSLLTMIAHLGPDHILHRIGCSALDSNNLSHHSWFHHIKINCAKYSLPDPLTILTNPPSKESFKRTVKSKVTDFWEKKLRFDASKLLSLEFFQPSYYSLSKPHPIFSSAGANPYEVRKACVQAKMLSGRFRSCWLSRHWTGNSSGDCSLPDCRLDPSPGTLSHLLLDCQDLHDARVGVFKLWAKFLRDRPLLFPIIRKYTAEVNPESQLQFLLDCTVLPEVISLKQQYGMSVFDSLLYLTRTFCFSLHKSRLKLLGKWNPTK